MAHSWLLWSDVEIAASVADAARMKEASQDIFFYTSVRLLAPAPGHYIKLIAASTVVINYAIVDNIAMRFEEAARSQSVGSLFE